jgi:hypothetical protein
MARSPVPAEGSRTTSLGVIAAAVLATNPSSIGVENCWSAWLSSERRVWEGTRAATLASMVRNADGDAARSHIAGPNFRRNRICAASQASYAVFQVQAPWASEPLKAAAICGAQRVRIDCAATFQIGEQQSGGDGECKTCLRLRVGRRGRTSSRDRAAETNFEFMRDIQESEDG